MEYCPIDRTDSNCFETCYFMKEGLCDYPYAYLLDEEQIKELTELIAETCAEAGIKWEDITGRKRDAKTALARQMVMYYTYQNTDLRLQQIGDILGGRTPATVSYGYQKIAAMKNGTIARSIN